MSARQDFPPQYLPPDITKSYTKDTVEKDVAFILENLPAKHKESMDADDISACRGLLLGVKPAILFAPREEPITDPSAIINYLNQSGFDMMMSGNFLINRRVLKDRIEKEKCFAREIGWRDDMSLDEFTAMANPDHKDFLGAVRTGFLLGFPVSSIRAFGQFLEHGDNSLLDRVDMLEPNGGRVYYFVTEKNGQFASDVNELKQKVDNAFQQAGYSTKK